MKKKFLAFILSFIILITLVACAAPNSDVPSKTTGMVLSTTTLSGSVPSTSSVTNTDPENYLIYTMEGTTKTKLTRMQTTVAEMTVEYGWTSHDGQIFLKQYGGTCDLGIIYGSDRYIYASIGTMVGVYHYLVDVQTGAVTDPLAALDAQIKERISEVLFSPDGNYALVFSHSSTVATLLDSTSKQSVNLPVAENVYSVFGRFIGDSQILLVFCFQDENGAYSYTFTRYSILTGETASISGEYQSADKNNSNFIGFCDGGILYTFTNGQFTIIDPTTWEKTVYPFGSDTLLSPYSRTTYRITTGGQQYLLHQNGDYLLIN